MVTGRNCYSDASGFESPSVHHGVDKHAVQRLSYSRSNSGQLSPDRYRRNSPKGEFSFTLKDMKKASKKICTRGHVYSGPGPCPICWPNGRRKRMKPIKKKIAKKSSAKKAYTHKHADGSVWAKGFLAGGKMAGFWKWYRKDGTLMRTGHFENGKQVDEWITYDKKGNIVKRTTFK
jgi:antitoxin component YwqK of YwqJK toxin-antitoxin module